jgi:hypothetical protein
MGVVERMVRGAGDLDRLRCLISDPAAKEMYQCAGLGVADQYEFPEKLFHLLPFISRFSMARAVL